MKVLIPAAIAAAMLFPMTAMSAEEADFSPAQSAIVTSLQKCFDQLGAADAIDIQKNYLKPYQECQRRLQIKLNTEKKKTAEAAVAPDAVPETPRNYVRVQKIPEKTQERSEDKNR